MEHSTCWGKHMHHYKKNPALRKIAIEGHLIENTDIVKLCDKSNNILLSEKKLKYFTMEYLLNNKT